MKKYPVLLVVVLISTHILISQEDYQLEKYLKRSEGFKYPNVIKINSLALPFSNISMTYERALLPRFSFLVSAGYKYSGDEPQILNANNSTIIADMKKITGYSFTPEVRYYLKSCEPHLLEGFYAGLYLRYTFMNTGVEFTYFPEVELQVEAYDADLALSEFGVGIQLGYQLMLWERFSIDFMFFGPRASRYDIQYEFDQEVTQDFLDELSDQINEILNQFEIDYNVQLEQKGGTKANARFTFANVRFGIGLGFAF